MILTLDEDPEADYEGIRRINALEQEWRPFVCILSSRFVRKLKEIYKGTPGKLLTDGTLQRLFNAEISA